MDRLKTLTLTVTLLCRILTFAQQNDSIFTETIFITTNTTTFVSGENLLYKIVCLNTTNNTLSDLSKVAYVKLISSSNKEIFTNTIFLKNGNFSGDYFINLKLQTGSYKLIAYTQWMLNNDVKKFNEIDIYIINPFLSINNQKNNVGSIASEKIEKIDLNSDVNFKFILNKRQFTCREKVDLSIISKNTQKGNYTLSVRKKEELPIINLAKSTTFFKTIIPQKISFLKNNIELPELRGQLISGKIVNKIDSRDIVNKTITLSILGKELQVKIVKTNKEGEFIFNIDKIYSSPNQIIQILEDNKEDFNLVLDLKKTPDLTNLIFLNPPFIDKIYKESLEIHSVANQIENSYYSKKADSSLKKLNDNKFYEPWQKTYFLNDYVRFPTLAETITEVIHEVYYTKNKDVYTIGLNDLIVFTEVPEPALVIIDGLVIQDLKELFEYKMSNIYKISTVQGGYYYGSNIFNGIISITTNKFDFTSNLSGSFILNANLQPTTISKKYFKQDYSDKQKNERIPDYRNQLFWDPNLDIEKPISFYTSDIKGIFEIVLDGFSTDGIPVHTIEEFEVK